MRRCIHTERRHCLLFSSTLTVHLSCAHSSMVYAVRVSRFLLDPFHFLFCSRIGWACRLTATTPVASSGTQIAEHSHTHTRRHPQGRYANMIKWIDKRVANNSAPPVSVWRDAFWNSQTMATFGASNFLPLAYFSGVTFTIQFSWSRGDSSSTAVLLINALQNCCAILSFTKLVDNTGAHNSLFSFSGNLRERWWAN